MKAVQPSGELSMTNDRGTITCNKMDSWQQHIPLSLERAQNILSSNLPPVNIDLLLYSHNPNIGSLSIDLAYAADSPTDHYFNDSRLFDPQGKTTFKGDMHVNGKAKGVGRTLMRNELDFFYAAGFNQFLIFAGSGTGGYTWARFGFLPDTDRCFALRKKLAETFNALSPYMNRAERRELSSLIKLRDASDIWHIADRQDDVKEWLHWGKAPFSAPLLSSLKILLKTLQGQTDHAVSMYELDQKMLGAKGLPTLGKCFLLGTTWGGTFDFAHHKQIKRASAYVGGFQCIPD